MALNTVTASGSFVGKWNASFDGATVPFPFSFAAANELTSGTGLDEADVAWWDSSRSLGATSESIDLAGSLTDPEGNTITMVKLKGIYIHNQNTTAGETLVLGGIANGVPIFDSTSDSITIGPDGTYQRIEPSLAGIAVTAGTGDLLGLDAGANTIVYDIVVFGTSS